MEGSPSGRPFSFTQWEYLVARDLRRPVFTFLVADPDLVAPFVSEDPALAAPPASSRIPDGSVSGDWFAAPGARSAILRHKTLPAALASWNADSDAESPCLQADGTLMVTQANGQVCFPKLHHGHRRIILAEAEAILVERGELPSEAAPQTQDGKTQDARLENAT